MVKFSVCAEKGTIIFSVLFVMLYWYVPDWKMGRASAISGMEDVKTNVPRRKSISNIKHIFTIIFQQLICLLDCETISIYGNEPERLTYFQEFFYEHRNHFIAFRSSARWAEPKYTVYLFPFTEKLPLLTYNPTINKHNRYMGVSCITLLHDCEGRVSTNDTYYSRQPNPRHFHTLSRFVRALHFLLILPIFIWLNLLIMSITCIIKHAVTKSVAM